MNFYEEKLAALREEIDSRLRAADALIGAQLEEILHHPEFQALEANWRGLHYLVREGQPGLRLKIKVLQATKRDLLKNFERTLEIEKSALFEKINGEHDFIYGLLVGADGFSGDMLDFSLLQHLSELGHFANCPFVSAPLPDFFGAEEKSAGLQNEISFVNAAQYRWNRLREPASARYLGLCMPRILLRNPYDINGPAFKFRERTGEKTLLWGNAAFAFAARIARDFNETSWFSKFNGAELEGEVENLPAHQLFENNGSDGYQISLETVIEKERLPELSDLGFMPLFQDSTMENPRFFGNQSVHKPGVYDSDAANLNARLCGQLSNILAASRFAHYLVDMVRYSCPPARTKTRRELEHRLQRWISGYVSETDDATPEYHAQKPMRECLIQVNEIPGQPGRYLAVMFIRPIYLLDAVLVALRLVVNFPSQ